MPWADEPITCLKQIEKGYVTGKYTQSSGCAKYKDNLQIFFFFSNFSKNCMYNDPLLVASHQDSFSEESHGLFSWGTSRNELKILFLNTPPPFIRKTDNRVLGCFVRKKKQHLITQQIHFFCLLNQYRLIYFSLFTHGVKHHFGKHGFEK